MSRGNRPDTRIELMRILGALSVFAYHYMGDVQSTLSPPFTQNGLWGTIVAAAGPFGVTLFVIISGIVFEWSYTRAGGARRFVGHRIRTLFSLYWWVAIPLITVALIAGNMGLSDVWKVPIWLTGLGIVSAATFFPIVDGWWYITLAAQLVLIYPLMRGLQSRMAPWLFITTCAAVSILSGLLLTDMGWSYAVPGFCGARLFEFGLGMQVGICAGPGQRVILTPLASGGIAVAAIVWVSSTATSLGSVVAVVVLLLVMQTVMNVDNAMVARLGGLSYAFYLCHSPWAKPVLAVLSRVLSPGASAVVGLCIALPGVFDSLIVDHLEAFR